MADVLSALSSKTRRQMLKLLLQKEAHISALARDLEISVPVALKHVRILEDCGLVSRETMGRSHVLRVNGEYAKRLEGVWWMIDEPFTVEVSKGTSMLDALRSVSGIEFKRTRNGAFISAVDGKDGYYVYEVDGRIVDEAVDESLQKDSSHSSRPSSSQAPGRMRRRSC